MNDITSEQPKLSIYSNREEMGRRAADAVEARIVALLGSKPFVNIIFASAPSQNEFLRHLSSKQTIDWSRVNAFHMDEYIGLPSDAPQAFGQFLKERLFSLVNCHTVNYMDGNAADAQAECQRYAALLQQYPTDLACLGIGENGHLAFNDPPVANFHDPEVVKIVELDHDCRVQQVNDGCFASLGQVPRHALTITIPPLLKPAYLFAIVPGKTKTRAIFNTMRQPIEEKYPSTILRTHPNTILFLDTDSAAML